MMHSWLAEPLPADVARALEQLRQAPDVEWIAVMPDVHLASDVCIGVAMATSTLLYPQAVGGDIGCGMLAVAFDAGADGLHDARVAAQVLAGIREAVPVRRRHRRHLLAMPQDLAGHGALEFGTLGSGNHFLELQADEQNRLWLMVHSGSRAVGPSLRDRYLAQARPIGGRLPALDAHAPAGRGYLEGVALARRYADASRKAIARQVGEVVANITGAALCWETLITSDHNHVALESHFGRQLWVHRKGAMRAQLGEYGVLPGSMGTVSFHVEGRGHPDALCSSAHGAGRKLSRSAARAKVSEQELRRQMAGVWFQSQLAAELRDEAPAAYKDIRAVLRAQRDLVKVTRMLRPLLNYKGV